MIINAKTLSSFILMSLSSITLATTITTEVFKSDGTSLGQVTFEDTQYGLLIKPQLSKLPEGLHGFHIHEHPDCGEMGMKAGGHFDPGHTDSHQGPYGAGHLGDLPILAVTHQGLSNTPLLAPRLNTSLIKGHALMIHEGGDTYSDTPALGGGGPRLGCGKIPL